MMNHTLVSSIPNSCRVLCSPHKTLPAEVEDMRANHGCPGVLVSEQLLSRADKTGLLRRRKSKGLFSRSCPFFSARTSLPRKQSP